MAETRISHVTALLSHNSNASQEMQPHPHPLAFFECECEYECVMCFVCCVFGVQSTGLNVSKSLSRAPENKGKKITKVTENCCSCWNSYANAAAAESREQRSFPLLCCAFFSHSLFVVLELAS